MTLMLQIGTDKNSCNSILFPENPRRSPKIGASRGWLGQAGAGCAIGIPKKSPEGRG